jgi:hypothetical protein
MSRLTKQETQTIRELVSQGLTAGQIAKQIGRGGQTVRDFAKRMALNLTPGRPGSRSRSTLANPRGRPSTILDRSPPGLSLAQRRHRATLPTLTIALDAAAHQILTAAAAHRRKPLERLCADVLEGTAFLGDINTQTAKLWRYRDIGEKQKQHERAKLIRAKQTNKPDREIASETAKAVEV